MSKENFGKAFDLLIEFEGGYVNDKAAIESAIWSALYAESNKIAKDRAYSLVNIRNYKCSVNGCNRYAYANGRCNAHELRARKGKPLDVPIRNKKLTSDVCIECGDPLSKHGSGLNRCPKHFKQLRTRVIKETLVRLFGSKCSKCGKSFALAVYDFHHTNGGKDVGIATLMNKASIKRIAAEASKCIIVCANCHREIHYAR